MLQLSGRLAFAPERGADFRKVGKLNTLVLEITGMDAMAHYYREQVAREYGPWCRLAAPLFGLHVTVIRGYGDKFDHRLARAEAGATMTVKVDPRGLARTPWAKRNPGFWYLPVRSKELTALRKRCKVAAEWPFEAHLTIGREQPNFMHARAPTNLLATAWTAFALIPSSQPKERGAVTGNQQLKAELETFIAAYHARPRSPMCTSEELMKLISRHITLPVRKHWEQAILNLFKYEGLTS